MLKDIVLLGNIGLKMLQENTGASGVRNGALEIKLRQGVFLSHWSPHPVYYCTTPPPNLLPSLSESHMIKHTHYSLMILIFEKHLGVQPLLSGARPILMIFSPILTSKMQRCRSKCGVMHGDG